VKLYRYLLILDNGRRKFTWAKSAKAALAKAKHKGLTVVDFRHAPNPLVDR